MNSKPLFPQHAFPWMGCKKKKKKKKLPLWIHDFNQEVRSINWFVWETFVEKVADFEDANNRQFL